MNACAQWVMEQVTRDGFIFGYVPEQKRCIRVTSESNPVKELKLGTLVFDYHRGDQQGIVVGINFPPEDGSFRILDVWFEDDYFPSKVRFEDVSG